MDFIEYGLFTLGAVYFLLAERGIVKLPGERRQLEFEERMRNKTWRYSFIILAYLLIILSIYRIVHQFF